MAQKLLTDETGQLILQAIKELDTVALNKIGNLTGLNTSNKASLVAAINELFTQRGALNSLTTPNKTSIVLAINEVWDTLNARTLPLTEGSTKALCRNSFVRNKFLGNSVTDAQWVAIKSGSFDDLYLGDYWIINGRVYEIAHFNYPGIENFPAKNLLVHATKNYGCGWIVNQDNDPRYDLSEWFTVKRLEAEAEICQDFGAAHVWDWKASYSVFDLSEHTPTGRAFVIAKAHLPSWAMAFGGAVEVFFKDGCEYHAHRCFNNNCDLQKVALWNFRVFHGALRNANSWVSAENQWGNSVAYDIGTIYDYALRRNAGDATIQCRPVFVITA